MTTENQIRANKENAQKSTGPLDTSKTKFNAVKHGLFCKKLVSDLEKEDFKKILQELIDEEDPKGIVELRIVDIMASALWDLQRIYSKESEGENRPSTYDWAPTISQIFHRYKKESENRFFKALKMLKEIKKD